METRITATELAKNLSDILNRVLTDNLCDFQRVPDLIVRRP